MNTVNELEMLRVKLEIQQQAVANSIHQIHENIAQLLILAKLNLGSLDLNQSDLLLPKVNSSKELINEAIKELRRIITYVNPENIGQLGLPQYLEYELSMLPQSRMADPLLEILGNENSLDSNEEFILFRLIQETLAIFIGHTSTSVISVQLQYFPDSLVVTLLNKENSPEEADISTENSNLESRIHRVYDRSVLLGADFFVCNILGKQTKITIKLPTQPLNNKINAKK